MNETDRLLHYMELQHAIINDLDERIKVMQLRINVLERNCRSINTRMMDVPNGF